MRRLLIILGSLAVLLVGAFFALPWLINADQFRPLLKGELEKSLKRPVELGKLSLTVFPGHHLVHCPVPMEELIGKHLLDLRVMHVEPALLRPPGDEQAAMVGAEHLHHPLAPLLWEMAMHGLRRELLPEIAGPAVYRVAPGMDIAALPADDTLAAAMQRLARQAASLRELADWPGMGRERAVRLLNALYLQSGLIVSRSHPDAVRESWFGA